MAADAREQRTTSADAGGDHLLSEALSGPVSAVYRYDEAFLVPKLMALFHFGPDQFCEVDLAQYYAEKHQRVGLRYQLAPFAQPLARNPCLPRVREPS